MAIQGINSGTSMYSSFISGMNSNSSNILSLFNDPGTSTTQTLFDLSFGSTAFQTRGIANARASAMADIRSLAKDSLSYLDKLSQKTDNVFQQMRVTSSDKDKVSVNSTANGVKAGSDSYKVEVKQLATAQTAGGKEVRATDKTLSTGNHTIAIDGLDGSHRYYTVNVTSKDDNQSAQQKLADTINKDSRSGVTAEVKYDKETKTSSLVLTAKKSGVSDSGQPEFTVRDTKGNAADAFGLNLVTGGQNAVYSVNGQERTSRSNEVELKSGVKATLEGVTDKPVTIGLQKDTKVQVSAMEDFVKQFNSSLSSARDLGGDKLARQFSDITRYNRSGFERLGISVGQDGSLSVTDSDKLTAAAESGKLQEFMQGQSGNRGVVGELSDRMRNVSGNASSYVDAAKTVSYNSNGSTNTNWKMQALLQQSSNFGMLL